MTDADDPDRFAALKAAFADLCEQDPAARAMQLESLRSRDADFAQALADLFERFDERDLRPDAACEGQQFGPFRVLRQLGSGGMGDVFLATRNDGGFEQQVALKRVRHAALSRDLVARFLRERQLLARLQHPGIARLIDGGVDEDGRPWLAMDYVEGLSLLRHARVYALGVPARLALVRQVCAAVAYAHRNLVVHRDLKPANVLVTADGETRLLDFGIAKLLDDSDVNITRLDQRAHTLRYAAPEQLAGDRTTTATDVHALGLLLYELVADAPPFARAAAGEVDWHRAILEDPPLPLSDALRARRDTFDRNTWRRISGDLDRIVRKALAKHAGDRYASVTSLDADLDDWLAARPLRSGIGGARAQTRYLLSRYRWPLMLAGGVLLASGIGAAVALQQAQRAREQAAAAQARLDTVLGVLGSANPHKFAAQEPSAGDFLVGAAALIERDGDDAELTRRALSEIAHALINLGRDTDAEPILQAALAAADRDGSLGDDKRLGILALMMNAQSSHAAATRAADTAARIEAIVRTGRVPDATAVDALARAAGTLSRSGNFETADRLLALGQERLAQAAKPPAGVVENYWRQRGWVALRAARADEAVLALREADAVIAATPAEFPALRRAEGARLLAMALSMQGDVPAARAAIDAARAVFEAEYPVGHLERASFDLDMAEIMLAEGNAADALRVADAAAAVFAVGTHEQAGDAFAAATLATRAAAAMRNCDVATARLHTAHERSAAAPVMTPQRARLLDVAVRSVNLACTH